jgi:hypothetical protein
MKKTGLIILAIGLALTVFGGFHYVTREKVIDIGSIEVMANKNHMLDWSPYLGVGIMAIGIIIYVVGARNK